MSDPQKSLATRHPVSPPFLPWLLVLFIASGSAALIYEIVWFQLLELVIGSSAVSLGVLLGTFMGGMCAGSLALPRIISPRRHPLRVLAALELGIGVIGISLLFLIPLIDRFYLNANGQGLTGILLRGAVCGGCLFPPTMMMGATLPAVARWLKTTPRGVSWLGFFYGGNTVGAVIGCLLAGFYLLRVHDTAVATFAAAAVNGSIALVAFRLAAQKHQPVPERFSAPGRVERAPGSWAVYVGIGLSGMCALGAEVIWTRLLSLLLGGTVYAFAIILAVFLSGLGLGSHVGSVVARSAVRPRAIFAGCQMLIAAAIAWTAVTVTKSLPYWPIDTSLASGPLSVFQLDLVRCIWALTPAAFLWGASFPLALASAARPRQDPGRLVGGIYAANTMGAIAGSLGFSLVVIPTIGTQQAHRLLMGLSVLAGLLLLAPQLPQLFTKTSRPAAKSSFLGAAVLAAATAVAVMLIGSIPKVPWELIAFGRRMPKWLDQAVPFFVGEGMHSSIAVTESKQGSLNFHVSGKIVASSDSQDMRLQMMLGHLPALLHPQARSVLVVGCGAGVTAGSFVLYPGVERIVICEIEPLIPQTAGFFFGSENHHVMSDPRVEVILDDARHFMLKTREKFDIITSDPIHPWLKGSAALYTQEYFDLCRRHLNPDGFLTQWVPLYESSPDVVKSEMATFFEVFPEGTIWSNDLAGVGYDVVLMGTEETLKIDVAALQERLELNDYRAAAQSLESIGFGTVVSLLATYAGRGPELKPWLEDAQINRDRNLRLQYLAGIGLNAQAYQTIFSDLLMHFQFPADLFIAEEPLRTELRKAFGLGK